MHEEKGNVKLFTSTDHKGMYRIAFKHQTTNEVYSMQDLKDLRDLITEELGEECEHRGSENGICNGCGKEVYPQPLTEGEKKNRDGMRDRATVAKENIAKKEKDGLRNRYQPQQESKEEELSEDSADKVVCTYCEMLDGHCDNCPLVGKKKGKICRSCLVGGQEPSKKPSQRIEDIMVETHGGEGHRCSQCYSTKGYLVAVIQYLDELHERKVI